MRLAQLTLSIAVDNRLCGRFRRIALQLSRGLEGVRNRGPEIRRLLARSRWRRRGGMATGWKNRSGPRLGPDNRRKPVTDRVEFADLVLQFLFRQVAPPTAGCPQFDQMRASSFGKRKPFARDGIERTWLSCRH